MNSTILKVWMETSLYSGLTRCCEQGKIAEWTDLPPTANPYGNYLSAESIYWDLGYEQSLRERNEICGAIAR